MTSRTLPAAAQSFLDLHRAARGDDKGAPPPAAGEDRLAVEHAEIARGVEAANARMSRVDQIKRFLILNVDWQPGGDELTPTMKLRRKPIHDKYAAEIDTLYG